MTVIVGMNERDTIDVPDAIADLEIVLRRTHPHLAALQEWNKVRDHATENLCADLGLQYHRPPHGGGPVISNRSHKLRSIRSRRLALPEFVGHLPGRRSRLGTSWATEAIYDSPGGVTVLFNYHLTAEVQDVRGGGGYKKDPLHILRVLRHRREKRRLGRRMRWHKRRARDVYAVGDSNFSDMTIGGFVNCWDGCDGGDLQGRAVTIVFAEDKPAGKPELYKTRSDHRAVAVTY